MEDKEIFFLNDPNYIEEVLSRHHSSFTKIFGFKRAKEFLGKGLFDNKIRWPLPRDFSTVSDKMSDLITFFINTLNNKDTFESVKVLKRLNIEILANTICHSSLTDNINYLIKLMDETIDLLYELTIPFPEIIMNFSARFKENFNYINNYFETNLIEHNPNILNNGNNEMLLRDRTKTTLLAAYEQIPALLSLIWYSISVHPHIEDIFFDELDRLAGTPLSKLDDYVYTNAIYKEALRLYPPVWILARKAIHTVEIRDLVIPTNKIVMMSQFIVQRSSLYFPNPEKFNPDRWLKRKEKSTPIFSFFPYNHGPRRCKGEEFVKIFCLSTLILMGRKWKLQCNQKKMKLRTEISLKPPEDITFTILKRN